MRSFTKFKRWQGRFSKEFQFVSKIALGMAHCVVAQMSTNVMKHFMKRFPDVVLRRWVSHSDWPRACLPLSKGWVFLMLHFAVVELIPALLP